MFHLSNTLTEGSSLKISYEKVKLMVSCLTFADDLTHLTPSVEEAFLPEPHSI